MSFFRKIVMLFFRLLAKTLFIKKIVSSKDSLVAEKTVGGLQSLQTKIMLCILFWTSVRLMNVYSLLMLHIRKRKIQADCDKCHSVEGDKS
jgi:hypothetical protein